MITRESLNKLGKARALEWDAEPNNWLSGSTQAIVVRSYEAGFSSALDLLLPGMEALEFISTDNYEDAEGMIRPTLSARSAREFLAKLEKELE